MTAFTVRLIMAHCLRLNTKNSLIADQVAANHQEADITFRQKAVLYYVIRVGLDSQSITDVDHAELRAHGFDGEDVGDISAIAAFLDYRIELRM